MEKKKYVKPSMEVYELKGMSNLLVGSIPDYGGEGSYIPAIPGTPDDEKQLA
jgi:hypothetical protein